MYECQQSLNKWYAGMSQNTNEWRRNVLITSGRAIDGELKLATNLIIHHHVINKETIGRGEI